MRFSIAETLAVFKRTNDVKRVFQGLYIAEEGQTAMLRDVKLNVALSDSGVLIRNVLNATASFN
jgi:hypothetical protein